MTRASARLGLTTIAAVFLLVAPAHASFPGVNGRIYFERSAGDPVGADDIWSMNPDGTSATPLVQSPAFDGEPAVSADGRQIAFASDRDGGDLEIFAMNVDGTNLRQLTKNNSIDDFDPAWSPDGTRIVFESNRDDSNNELYTMSSVDGSDVRRITNNAVADDAPAWSPDGTKIAYNSPGSGGTDDIFTVAPTGGPVTNVTQSTGVAELHANWSPDGTKLAYNADGQLSVVNANGSGAHQITSGSDFKQRAKWSPDGTRLVYADEVDLGPPGGPTDEVFTVGADGSNPTNLSNLKSGDPEDFQADWAVALPPPPPAPPAKFAGLHVSAQKVTVSRKRVASISVDCPAATNGSCAGTLTLKTAKAVTVSAAAKKRKHRRKVLTLGRAKFTIAAGKTAKVRVKLSKRGFKLLKAKHTLKTKATVVSHDAAAATVTAKVNVKLKAPRAPRKKHRR